jgi:hypothetical protein
MLVLQSRGTLRVDSVEWNHAESILFCDCDICTLRICGLWILVVAGL